MKKVVITMFLIIMVASLYGQSPFFPTAVGTELTYADTDAKGRVSGYSKTTITNITGSGVNMTISYVVESLDKNRRSSNPPQEVPLTAVIRNNIMTLDMKAMFASRGVFSRLKDRPFQITGTPLEIPSNIQPGQALKNAEMAMSVNIIISTMTIAIKMTDGFCEAIENIKVQAGTFTCHKIVQNVFVRAMGSTETMKVISWYALGIGIVKTITYNPKNEIHGSTELIELK
jgi:hypothetical protein